MNWQRSNEAVDVSKWQPDDEFGLYPEGTREKQAIFCPREAPYPFLVADHRYLLKHSVGYAPEQYWCEIAAYRIGELLDIWVPPAHAAFNSDTGEAGALIEWFYGHPQGPTLRYTPGGDPLTTVIDDYDRGKGRKHNLNSIIILCRALRQGRTLAEDWLPFWAKTLTFDALIGNTDRHQDNWGFLWHEDAPTREATFAPAFDNGTSMGYEMPIQKFQGFADHNRTLRYLAKGSHHMRWKLGAETDDHWSLVSKLIETYSDARKIVEDTLRKTNPDQLFELVVELTRIETITPLTNERAHFMGILLRARYAKLVDTLD